MAELEAAVNFNSSCSATCFLARSMGQKSEMVGMPRGIRILNTYCSRLRSVPVIQMIRIACVGFEVYALSAHIAVQARKGVSRTMQDRHIGTVPIAWSPCILIAAPNTTQIYLIKPRLMSQDKSTRTSYAMMAEIFPPRRRLSAKTGFAWCP